jgi:hypothetical protein
MRRRATDHCANARIDLAYTYIPLHGDSFRNLAMAAHSPAQDVPEFITVK